MRPREGLELVNPVDLASTKSLRYDHYSDSDINWENINIDNENETHPSSRAGHQVQVRFKFQTKHLETTTSAHE